MNVLCCLCSAQSVGVIVRLERENFQILNMIGKVYFISWLSLLSHFSGYFFLGTKRISQTFDFALFAWCWAQRECRTLIGFLTDVIEATELYRRFCE